jgi:hypothetical protein
MHGVRNPARRVALAAVLATSLLACWSGGAFGNPFHEVPKQYRGIWCDGRQDDEVTEFYRRCRRGGDYSMEIQARQFADSRYYECPPIALIRTDHGDLIVQAVCRPPSVEYSSIRQFDGQGRQRLRSANRQARCCFHRELHRGSPRY